MFDFFFYGTLIDADIRALVLGREVPDAACRRASLPGLRRYPVTRRPYPAAIPEADASLEGIVMPGADLRDAAKLSCFEGADYEATLRPVEMSGGGTNEAWVYIASEAVPRDPGEWSFETWQARHKAEFLEIANGWLDQIDPAELAAQEAIWRARR